MPHWLCDIEERLNRDTLGVILSYLNVADVYGPPNSKKPSRAHEDLFIYARFGFKLRDVSQPAAIKIESEDRPLIQNDDDWLDEAVGKSRPIYSSLSYFSQDQLYQTIVQFLAAKIEITALRLISECYWGLDRSVLHRLLRDAIRTGCVRVVLSLHPIIEEEPTEVHWGSGAPQGFVFTECAQIEYDDVTLAIDSKSPDMVLLVSQLRSGHRTDLNDLQRAITRWEERLSVELLDKALCGSMADTHRALARGQHINNKPPELSRPQELANFLSWVLSTAKTPVLEQCALRHLKIHGKRTGSRGLFSGLFGSMFG